MIVYAMQYCLIHLFNLQCYIPPNLNLLQITFNKRKNGLLKKACELAVLCNVKMLLSFTDLGNEIQQLAGNVYQFASTENIEMELIQAHHKKLFTKADYPGFQKKKDSDSQSEASSIEPKRTRAQDQQNMLQQQQQQLIQQHQQLAQGAQPMRLRKKIIDHLQPEPRKIVKEEEEIQIQVKKKNEDIVFNDIIDHQQARNFDDLYQCGNQYDEQSNSQQDQQDYNNKQLSMFTSSNPVKLMKMDSLLNGNNNSKPNNFLSDQYNKFFSKDRMDSLNNSKILQPSVQFIVPPQVYFNNINPSPINQAMNKVFVGVDEPIDNIPQFSDGFKKYTK